MPRLCFITEFDGTGFAGFQSQENGRAVQDVLESALAELFKEKIRLTGCSRTDAGVHAKCHLSHADVPFVIPEEKFPLAMNALLPDDVAVKRAFYVKDDFSARFSINGKRYIYRIYVSNTRSPMLDRYAYYCPVMPDIEAGNAFYKAMTLFAQARTAGILWGAQCPVVVPSRGDNAEAKFNSIIFALACL